MFASSIHVHAVTTTPPMCFKMLIALLLLKLKCALYAKVCKLTQFAQELT